MLAHEEKGDERELASEAPWSFDAMQSVCPRMQEIFQRLEDLARSDAPVLIRGETGTGRECAAIGLHRASPRRARPFIKVVCTAMSEEHLDALLAGATMGEDGLIKSPLTRARGGTLLLHDIGALDWQAQGVLLRRLHTEPSMELDSRRASKRVRLISTSETDLSKRVKQGRFREELFYRLVVGQILLPPLRERRVDFQILAQEAIRQAAQKQERSAPHLHPQTRETLAGYSWPGNLRELYNVLDQAVLRLRGRSEILPADIADLLFMTNSAAPAQIEIPLGTSLAEAERKVIMQTLAAHGFKRYSAAAALKISRRTIYSKLESFKKQGWLP